MEPKSCLSCKALVTNQSGATKFLCPSCGKAEVVRCQHCREQAVAYTCSLCRFEGPN